MEARRAELHARLDRVLVIDARFPWNGVGNSLVRWLTLLRVGLASGRATFLWLSDFPESGLEQVYACLRIFGAREGNYPTMFYWVNNYPVGVYYPVPSGLLSQNCLTSSFASRTNLLARR